MNQFGGDLGGPIVKDRTFFYINYEGLRQSLGDTQSAALCAERRGPCPGYRHVAGARTPRQRVSKRRGAHIRPIRMEPTKRCHMELTAPAKITAWLRIDHKFNDSTTAVCPWEQTMLPDRLRTARARAL